MKVKKFIKETYDIALMLVDIPVGIVSLAYEGVKSIHYQNAEIKRIKNNINPNKVKIIDKLESLNQSSEMYALVLYTPEHEMHVGEAPQRIEIVYKNKRYVLRDSMKIEEYPFEKLGYEIGFNHQYDAKHFLDNAKAINILDLPEFVANNMINLSEKDMDYIYDSLDAKFNLSIFREKELLSDILSDEENDSILMKKRHKI